MRALALPLGAALLFSIPSFADELEELGRAIEEHPDDAKTYDAYALTAIRQKRFDDAIRSLKVGVARLPDYSEGYYKLAYVYRQKHEWADAADYYRRYLALQPDKADPYFGLGAALEGLGDRRGAIAAYEKYVALEKAPEKQHFVDQAKAEMAKLQSASQAAAPSLSPPPAAPSTSFRAQAEERRKQGKLEEARLLYEKALAAEPNNLDLYSELGNVYFALKQYEEAVRLFQAATAKLPDFALGWYDLAHALRKSDRPQEAAVAYRHYMKIRPEDPDPYYGLGEVLKATGDVKGAAEAFRRYIDMEKRPAEQRWVDKARTELQGLQPSSRIEQQLPGLFGSADPDALLPMSDEQIDPYTSDGQAALQRDLRDSLGEGAPLWKPRNRPPERLLQQYGRALAAYRQALNHHAEEVLERYERGLGQAMADNVKAAEETWNGVSLADPQLDAARRAVEKARSALTSTISRK